MTALPPRPYQIEALAAIRAAEARGIRRQLIALPTGTSKTVIIAHVAAQRRYRTLILVRGIAHDPGITAGEASDLIAASFVRGQVPR